MGTQIGDALREAMRLANEKREVAESDVSRNTKTLQNSIPAAQGKEAAGPHSERRPSAFVGDPPYRLHWAGKFEPNPFFAESRERR